ncbi:MAG: hypothetical protein JWO07_356 [Candidatus Saccharibacteria bacterium]|nr:hypothetical protein [Candidatus Saccharibacteria bacterium]
MSEQAPSNHYGDAMNALRNNLHQGFQEHRDELQGQVDGLNEYLPEQTDVVESVESPANNTELLRNLHNDLRDHLTEQRDAKQAKLQATKDVLALFDGAPSEPTDTTKTPAEAPAQTNEDDVTATPATEADSLAAKKAEILNDDELSNAEKLEAVKNLGETATKSALDTDDDVEAAPANAKEAEPSKTPEADVESKEGFKIGQEVVVRRNVYKDGKIDRTQTGPIEEGWKVNAVNPDGSYRVSIDSGSTHDGKTGRLSKNVRLEELQGVQEEYKAAERSRKAEDAIRQFSDALSGSPANLDPTNLPAYEGESASSNAAEHTPGTPEYEALNAEVHRELSALFDRVRNGEADVDDVPEKKEKKKGWRERLKERRERYKAAKPAKAERRAEKKRIRAEAAGKKAQDKREAEVLKYNNDIKDGVVNKGRVGNALRKLKTVGPKAADLLKRSVTNDQYNADTDPVDSMISAAHDQEDTDVVAAADALNRRGEVPEAATEDSEKETFEDQEIIEYNDGQQSLFFRAVGDKVPIGPGSKHKYASNFDLEDAGIIKTADGKEYGLVKGYIIDKATSTAYELPADDIDLTIGEEAELPGIGKIGPVQSLELRYKVGGSNAGDISLDEPNPYTQYEDIASVQRKAA